MRSIEVFLSNPFFGLFVALVLVVIGIRLSTNGEQVILAIAWCLFFLSVLRTPPISRQDWIPRIFLTLAMSSFVGLGLCCIAGWRPLLSQFRASLFAMVNDGNYPSGTNIGGIDWSPRFSDLRIVVMNASDSDYNDLDLTLQPDVSVAAIGQISNLPDVSFSPVADPTYSITFVDGATKRQTAIPLVLVSSDGGYRVRCVLLPRKRKLEIIMAVGEIIDFPKPGKGNPAGVLKKDYVLRIGLKDNQTQKDTGNWYGYGRDGPKKIEEIYKENKPIPKAVQIDGAYTVDGELETVSQKIDAKDIVGDFLNHSPANH